MNIEQVGIRPRFDASSCAHCTKCLTVCPGHQIDAGSATGANGGPKSGFAHEFGEALEIWEGHATDPEIRHRASSGGILTALALYCLEHEGMGYVLHSAMDDKAPWSNRTVESRSRAELMSRAGSRYAPASPCDSLRPVKESAAPVVFIGKPCDTAAVFKMRAQDQQLDQKLGLVLAFFCAGTPSSRGSIDLIKSLGIEPQEVDQLRYRGRGWPGRFTVNSTKGEEKSLSYQESWGKLTHYRPTRCHLCPDGLGRIADIASGDAWDKFEEDGDPGRSLILVRTRRGQEILRRAIAAGYITAKPARGEQVMAAQKNLLARRREIFGRLLGMKLLGVPVPKLEGFSLLRGWASLPLKHKARTVAGTMTRWVQRGKWRRQPLFEQQ